MSDSGTNHPFKSLFQAVDPDGQSTEADQQVLLNVLQEIIGEDWETLTEQVGLLFEGGDAETSSPAAALSFSSPISSAVDYSVLSRLAQNVEAATGLVAQLSNADSPTPLNLLRQLDFHLAEAAMEISDIQQRTGRAETGQVEDQGHSVLFPALANQPKPTSRNFFRFAQSKKRIPWQFLLALGCLFLPFGVKLVLPRLITAQEAVSDSHTASANLLYQVVEVQPQSLQVRRADGTNLQVRLLGLTFSEGQWQSETTAVLSMLLQASGGQIRLQSVIPDSTAGQLKALKQGSPLGVMAQLPNGTSLQEILLSNGLVRINEAEMSSLPSPAVAHLRAAQASAQAQRKNIWGEAP